MMDKREARILRLEARKYAKIEHSSRRLQKLRPSQSLDFDSNPFCLHKQERDQREMERKNLNRICFEDSLRRDKGLTSNKKKKSNRLRDVLQDTLHQLRLHDEYEPDPVSRSQGNRKAKNRPLSPTFGHRPGSASRHVDVLSLTQAIYRNNDGEKKKADHLPKAGIFSSDDLYKLIHAPRTKPRRRKREPRQPSVAKHDKEWDDRIFDPLVLEHRGQRNKLEVNAIGGNGFRKSSDQDFKSYTQNLHRIAAGNEHHAFCQDRQVQDQIETQHKNFYHKFPVDDLSDSSFAEDDSPDQDPQ